MAFLFTKLSLKLLFIVSLLGITKELILPKFALLIWVCVLMVADLVTGLLKARFQKQKITSERLRDSVIKFLQYFGSIGLIVVVANQNIKSERVMLALTFAQDTVTILIIYIECLSIFENLYAMDKKTPFAMYVIRPIYQLLSWAVRRNPIKEEADKLKDQDEKQEEP